jgi:hypothetical protein
LPAAIPVEVERHDNATTSEVGVQVIPKSGLVGPAYVAPRHDNLVLLQLRKRGRTGVSVE